MSSFPVALTPPAFPRYHELTCKKQAIVDRIVKEVSDLEGKIAESTAGLKQAEKGREDTVSKPVLV
jgi:hypothetical protein